MAESVIYEYVQGVTADDETLALAHDLAADTLNARDVQADIERLETRLANLSRQHEMGALTDAAFRQRRLGVEEQQAALRAQAGPSELTMVLAELDNLTGLLQDASPESLGRFYQATMRRIRVEPSDQLVIETQPGFLPLFAAHHLRQYGTGSTVVAPTGFEPVLPA